MAECVVLRCPIPATKMLGSTALRGREVAFCVQHYDLIEAGAEWRMDSSGILMGEDLKALGEFVVESMNVWRGNGVDSISPEGFLVLQLKIRRRGTVEMEERNILLPVADAAKWAMGFKISAGW